MIVVDTSALVAILLEEPAAEACAHALALPGVVLISAGTLTEAHVVAARRGFLGDMVDLIAELKLTVVSVDATTAAAAGLAYAHYGKGLHAASLNFGDTFAYVLAKQRACPLLFIGNDFALTDVTPALR
jgi:ribonuclease VapC